MDLASVVIVMLRSEAGATSSVDIFYFFMLCERKKGDSDSYDS